MDVVKEDMAVVEVTEPNGDVKSAAVTPDGRN